MCSNFLVQVRWTNFSVHGSLVNKTVRRGPAVKPFLFAFLSKSVDIKNDALIKLRENEPRAISNCQGVHRAHHGLGIQLSRSDIWLQGRSRRLQDAFKGGPDQFYWPIDRQIKTMIWTMIQTTGLRAVSGLDRPYNRILWIDPN